MFNVLLAKDHVKGESAAFHYGRLWGPSVEKMLSLHLILVQNSESREKYLLDYWCFGVNPNPYT